MLNNNKKKSSEEIELTQEMNEELSNGKGDEE